jgi:hypothetical protein
MHDAEMSNTQSLTLGRNPRRRTTTDLSPNGSRYATAPRHSSLDSRYTTPGGASNSLTRAAASKSPRFVWGLLESFMSCRYVLNVPKAD